MTDIIAQRESLGQSKKQSLAEGEQQTREIVRRFQRRKKSLSETQRFSLGYDVGRRWRRYLNFQTRFQGFVSAN